MLEQCLDRRVGELENRAIGIGAEAERRRAPFGDRHDRRAARTFHAFQGRGHVVHLQSDVEDVEQLTGNPAGGCDGA